LVDLERARNIAGKSLIVDTPTCGIPDISAWDPDILPFLEKKYSPNCFKADWTYVENYVCCLQLYLHFCENYS